jgi:hypothetical protein
MQTLTSQKKTRKAADTAEGLLQYAYNRAKNSGDSLLHIFF